MRVTAEREAHKLNKLAGVLDLEVHLYLGVYMKMMMMVISHNDNEGRYIKKHV